MPCAMRICWGGGVWDWKVCSCAVFCFFFFIIIIVLFAWFLFWTFLGIHVCVSVRGMMEWFCNFLLQLQFPEVVRGGGGKANGFNS